MKKLMFTALAVFLFFDGVAQETKKPGFFDKHPIVNQLEVGALFGRIKLPQNYYTGWGSYWPCQGCNPSQEQQYTVQKVRDISVRMYTGLSLNPKTSLGLTIGADDYEGRFITPIMFGARQTLIKKKSSENEIFAALDIGHGNIWFHEDPSNLTTKGGLALNPAIGYKLKLYKEATLLFSLGYNFQQTTVTYDNFIGDEYSNIETRQHRRLTARVGFQF